MCSAMALSRTLSRLAACRRSPTASRAAAWPRRPLQAAAVAATAPTASSSMFSSSLSASHRSMSGMRAASSSTSSITGSMAAEVCSIKCCLADVPGGMAEEVAEVLLAYGAQSVAVEEYRPSGGPEQEIYADTEGRVWDRCTVVAYFPPEEDGAAILASTAADFGLQDRQQLVEAVRTQDWEQSIRDSYQPAQVGEGLWIVPIWSQAPDPAATNIILEPGACGLAFGTGDHPTTRLCLRWLQRLQQAGSLEGAAVMDYGAGSGVLAVAALLMGAERAVGSDVEPLAVKATQANAALNGVSERVAAYLCAGKYSYVAVSCCLSCSQPYCSYADLKQPEPLAAAGIEPQQRLFEVTVANILQGPLLDLAPRLAAYTKPSGLLGLSGILQEQTAAVMEAYSPWFHSFQVEGEQRWALVTAVRRTDT
ncbi:Ribosomal protein L11 methyltransferase [Chlorella vulgaris]